VPRRRLSTVLRNVVGLRDSWSSRPARALPPELRLSPMGPPLGRAVRRWKAAVATAAEDEAEDEDADEDEDDPAIIPQFDPDDLEDLSP
jgi:hypothetical protein